MSRYRHDTSMDMESEKKHSTVSDLLLPIMIAILGIMIAAIFSDFQAPSSVREKPSSMGSQEAEKYKKEISSHKESIKNLKEELHSKTQKLASAEEAMANYQVEIRKLQIQLKKIQSSSSSVTLQKCPQPNEYRLFIEATPPDSIIQITNIGPAYMPYKETGMCLHPGTYDIKILKNGATAQKTVVLNKDMIEIVSLNFN